ncbi:hypothetical protein HGRIS_014192 [Hohenbuehelia grisea]
MTRLPYSMMHPYAETIISKLKPTNVSLLDQYPAPVYISSAQLPLHQAQIRYITTQASTAYPDIVHSFDPPNLISTTSAAFMAILNMPASQVPATLFLLPGSQILPPPPRTLEPSDFDWIQDHEAEWSAALMDQAHVLLNQAVGVKTPAKWAIKGESGVAARSAQSKPKIGEGSMYI